MTGTRIETFTIEGLLVEFFISDCANCGVLFGMPKDLERRRRKDRQRFYCPNGHYLVFAGKTDAQKLEESQARETALRDQLSAAIRDGEQTRQALLRDRQRFANGVCPCCNRTFQNVLRHMRGEHPDYDVTKIKQTGTVAFKCSCGRSFESLHGLRVHQGRSRRSGWDAPNAYRWRAHLTVATA